MAQSYTRRNEPIAIVGSGCRFPGGANSPSKLWELLKAPKDLVKKIPQDRFNVDAFYHSDGSHHGRTNAQHAYFLDQDPYTFDPGFFNIPPSEVDTIDPQQRLLLETVYEGLSAAGLRLEDLRGSPTAVYVGMMQRDFLDHQNYDLDSLNTYAATGTSASILSNRVSYVFDWHGPSMTIDTACSSSLVAVHHAVEQLRTGLSQVAVAAGTNLILGPIPFISASKLNMFSPTGRSRMWDVAADGYARGEGVAAVVLKTLSQAIADGDSVECVIRESGINQDGKTAGITMPNPLSQEALIRQVYQRAGLDLNKPEDRCQYFEAHGTGTPAGDPKEAQAISSAFFQSRARECDEEPLYVGSIKTIIGHTEGTAGIAGLIKASQVIQHGILPPNMLFNELNPSISPFYTNLKVVTEQRAWPTLKYGQPRRVSVNSFGFGGTNAHVIVEEHTPTPQTRDESSSPCLAPIALSANSESSLRASLEDLKHFIKQNSSLRLEDLAWTLLKKRSNLQFRYATTANSLQDLSEVLERDAPLLHGKQTIAVNSDVRAKPEILGIFTGQGAQWPAMGRSLLREIPYVHGIVEELDRSLQALPDQYRPFWTLMDQLLLEGQESNVHDAVYSQPLCCAVQIVLIKLLEAAGISFKVVLGHSSGEIACAYAAGFVSASQAIRIAHLRGLTSRHAGASGVEGAMMAVGTSFDDATELCALEAFEGRITVAASNSPESVTLSGDRDALLEAQEIFNEESKFNRILKVDKAYHSHHMIPCSEPYVAALKACGCDSFDLDVKPHVTWISSVHEGRIMKPEDLKAEYWRDNLLSPVLFSYAVEQAMVKHLPLDICVEVGAHATLKNPALQTIQNCYGSPLPYTGCMDRKMNDVAAFSSCLSYIWSRFGSKSLDVDKLFGAISIVGTRDLSKQIPSYSWDHSRSYRKESRTLRAWLEAERPHLLLGRKLAYSSATSIRWQNFIRQRDIEWLDGHSLQGQTVFPGAGYVVMAMEAATKIAGDREIALLEVLDLRINKAVTFEDEESLIELNLALDLDMLRTTDIYTVYRFTINSALAREAGLSVSASGTVAVTHGASSLEILPAPQERPPHLNNVSIDRFYTMLQDIGYGYTKQFRGISSLSRGDSKACGSLTHHRLEHDQCDMVIHPITLDTAFQGLIGAYTAPGDRRLRSIFVPTGCDRIALNPKVAGQLAPSHHVEFHAISTAVGSTISGDIDVFEPELNSTIVQVEGIRFKPFSPPSPEDDHEMFSKWSWEQIEPDSLIDDSIYHATQADQEIVGIIERVTYWYIKSLLSSITAEDREHGPFHFKKQIQWYEHVVAETAAGRNVWYDASWESDSRAHIESLIQQNSFHPFMRLIQRVGESGMDTFRNGKSAFDLMDHDGLLTEFYGSTLSYGHSYKYFRRILEQFNHRYQNLDVLEIGAGTGGATRYFLNPEPISFNSYTFTDISSAFFEQAAAEFANYSDKLDFRTLDIRQPPSEQEFKPNSFDLIVASNVLHATPKLEETLLHVRSLLKPGGRLIVIEVAHREHTRIGFIFGLFTDWWSGHDEGRILEPFVSYDKWDEVLKKTGFSGIDTRTLDPDSTVFPNGVFMTHSVDSLVQRLDSPLAAPVKNCAPLFIIGGSSVKTAKLLDELSSLLSARKYETVPSIREAIDIDYDPESTFIVLSELDHQTFAGFDHDQIDAMQTIFNTAKHILWVTEDAWVANPQQAMTIGFLRTIRMEYPDVHIQVLNCDDTKTLKAEFLVETLLRLEDGSEWQESGILWTQEPELYLSKGKVIVPRLKPDMQRNNRLNSGRRSITAEIDPAQETVSLEYEANKPTFRYLEERYIPEGVESVTSIHVQYSLPAALRIGHFGYFYLVQGKSDAGDTVAALSEVNASLVRVPNSRLARIEPRDVPMFAIAARLVAQTLLADIPSGSSVLVFEPGFYVGALSQYAAAAEIQLHFASTSAAVEDVHWIQLHEKETQRSLEQKVPRNISVFINLSCSQSPAGLHARLPKYLPRCSVRDVDYLFQAKSIATNGNAYADASRLLAQAASMTTSSDGNILKVSEIPAWDSLPLGSVIDWASEQKIPALVRSMETGRIFVSDKTYLLIGLAGDLGRSIARFMVERGARNIVLSSRSPKIDQRWIDDVTLLGGNIMVLPMDVSDEASVDAGLALVRASMPPIAGVAFGPLVLQDVMFKNMDLSMLEMVLAPKVTGARLLDERLSDPENPLDFFVMFSSFVMVSGNPGQAAYSAANAYTHALAQQRRSRGMAGSTIDIGAVFGVGFIARAGREHEYDVLKFLFDEVNEWELHALFAEAVISGRNWETDDVEVVTGMPYMDPINRARIPYFDDPRFSYFKMSDRKVKSEDAAGVARSVKDQLLEAETWDEVRTIVSDNLCIKIRAALQLTNADELNLATPLIDQGVDSLSAVTIASWFSKNLNIDIPLLKILGGASVNDLVDESMGRVASELVPLASSSTEKPAEAEELQSTPSSASLKTSGQATPLSDFVLVPTPPSQYSDDDDGVEKQAPLSITQEYSWKQQQLSLDPTTFNSTIGMYMEGHLNLERLAWAFNQVLQRNDAFRTCFVPDPAFGLVQDVMKRPRVSFEAIKVANKAAADQRFKELEAYPYDLAKGDTLKIVNLSWSPNEHLLIIAYHRLVGDGWTTEHVFVEAGKLYSGVQLDPAPSYADFAARQRKQFEAGEYKQDLDYWHGLFENLPKKLAPLDVPDVQSHPGMVSWREHELSARLDPMIGIRIKDRSRKHKVTPMHYYLAAFHVLLARLSASTEVVIGIADTNRPTLVDQATMGYFASILPLRLAYSPDKIFNEVLTDAKEQMRKATLHGAVPYMAILERLGLPMPSLEDPDSHAPLFQAVFDYKQGQAESGSIGDAKIVASRTPRARSPYHIILEISDDPTKDPLITFKLQQDLYGPQDTRVVLDAYLSVLSIFSRNPALRVEDGSLQRKSN
ncbi:putative polyketide synthase [Paramyrothecium foliicola]|nr:putative polyketide synthase [Paramyrothecium foliicola]